MPSITSLISQLQHDHPNITFKASGDFHWSYDEQTVHYVEKTADEASFLHEVAHALLGHRHYRRDIELLTMEQAAWQYATETLVPRYGVVISEDETEAALDTYREWLHARSICPHCKANGLQSKQSEYKCIVCGMHWRVNEARTCALRRYPLPANKKYTA